MPSPFFYYMCTVLAKTALDIAITQLNKEENPRGSNWGYPVQDYLAAVNIHFPASWCMAFIYWSFNQAAKQLNTINPLVQTGGVLFAWNHAKSHQVGTPEVGDIFILDFHDGTGHTGIVAIVDGTNVHTIEGNTNDLGSREGFEVCRRIRPIAKMKGFLRY